MKTAWLLIALSVACAVAPWMPHGAASSPPVNGFSGWDQAPLPAEAAPIRLGPREERFAREFPGSVGAFAEGRTTWIVRWVAQPTRKLHSAADCLRGSGFTVVPGAAWKDAAGRLWGAFTASRAEDHYRVHERIVGSDGRVWTDVSAWYWHALFGQAQGPWWAVTRIEPVSGPGEAAGHRGD